MDSAIRGNRDARSFCAIELSCPVCAGAIGGNAMQTKKAIGNLLNRYRAVLKKCHLLNTFGTLALASAFILGGAASAMSDTVQDTLRTTHSLNGVTYGEPFNYYVNFESKITDSTFSGASLKDDGVGGGVFYFNYAPGVTTITNSAFNGNVVENDSLMRTPELFLIKVRLSI